MGNCPEELLPVMQARKKEYFSKEVKEELRESTEWRKSEIAEQSTNTGIQRKDDSIVGKNQKAITSIPFSPEHPNLE